MGLVIWLVNIIIIDMKILQLTCHYHPNIGGVETHLNDLVKALIKRNNKVYVLTYRPLTTKSSWRIIEKEDNLEILRIPWIFGLFYKLVPYPIFEFIYLFPGLFVMAPIIILTKNIQVIHAHGLIAGSVGYFWGRLLNRRIIISTHNLYNFSSQGFYRNLSSKIFKGVDKVLTLSIGSAKEIEMLGVDKNKIQIFTYWVDLEKFKCVKNAKAITGWRNKFVVLFVGRLVAEKGIRPLLDASKIWNKNIILAVAGTGPLETEICAQKSVNKNLIFLGKIDNNKLPIYYSAADLFIIPSTHEEGFGRVIIESLACGTPVIGSNRGAIPDAIDDSVGRLINVTPVTIKKTVEYFYENPKILSTLSKNARKFAEKRYSEKNAIEIMKSYM